MLGEKLNFEDIKQGDGLASSLDQSETPDTLAKKRKTGVLAKEMIGSTGNKSGFKYDCENVERAPNIDKEGREIGEEHIINLVDARQKRDEQKKRSDRLNEGKAILISKPETNKPEDAQEKGDRQFNTVGELMDFREKREEAMEKARQRYNEKQSKETKGKEKKSLKQAKNK